MLKWNVGWGRKSFHSLVCLSGIRWVKWQLSTKDIFSVLFQQSKHLLKMLCEKFVSCFKAQYAVSAVGALLGLAAAEHALVQCEVWVVCFLFHNTVCMGAMRRVRWSLSNEEYRFLCCISRACMGEIHVVLLSRKSPPGFLFFYPAEQETRRVKCLCLHFKALSVYCERSVACGRDLLCSFAVEYALGQCEVWSDSCVFQITVCNGEMRRM